MIKLLILLFFVKSNLSFNESIDIVSRSKRNSNFMCGVSQQKTGLIVGGEILKRGAHPWMVALLLRDAKAPPKFFCSGILISSTKILTGKSIR